jgi:hypothetical protein
VGATDAQRYLGDLSTWFAICSLGAVLFFRRRASGVSLALIGWWLCLVVGSLMAAPQTISGSEDVARWATEAAWLSFAGLVVGGWVGSTIARPRASARSLMSYAALGAVAGAGLVMAFVRLSYTSCNGPLSAEELRRGVELDTTFCAFNDVMGRWAIVYVVMVVSVILWASLSARRDAMGRGSQTGIRGGLA